MKQLLKSHSRVFAVFIVGIVVSVSAVIPANTASASVAAFDCSAWTNSPVQANARCNLGLGGVRAWADCYSVTLGITLPRKYGPTKPVGSISSVICYSGSYVVNYGYQIQ
jgi:hypothetical protein